MKQVNVFGLSFSGLQKKDILIRSDRIKFIVTVNAEFIVEAHRNEKFRQIINNNISTFDGQIPYFFARMKRREFFFEKISGSDFIYDVIEKAKKDNDSIFLLGDSVKNNSTAIQVLKRNYDVRCTGYSPEFEKYPFSAENNERIFTALSNASPVYLFVAFGAVKQELWINDNITKLNNLNIKYVIGCGGTISFVAGNVKRAPLIVQKLGLESFYRVIQEPKFFRFKRIFKSFIFFKYIFY